jgi:pyrroline-5-carboxylate reductase
MMKICIIGAGIIGSSIAKSLLLSNYGSEIVATDREVEKLKELKEFGARITLNNKKAADEATVVILSVKPKNVKNVLTEIQEEVKGKLVISVAAAISLESLKSLAPEARFVRAMPNVAVLVQESFTAYCFSSEITKEDRKIVEEIFGKMGKYIEVEETHLNAITGLSGSGPAYVSIIIEAMMYAGLKVGLPRKLSLLASTQTVIGTGKLILESKKHVAELKDMVVTPGGTTIEGIYQLEDSGLRTAIMRAVEAAMKKSEKISETINNQ